ncbi:MAG: UrcA family protein [bacterium]|nr:UrcA family protein [bacterium]
MSKFINRLAAVAALALAATPIVGLAAAHAAERGQPEVRIQIGDLRLSRPADAAEFMNRVDTAAHQVCAARTVAEKLRGLSVRACITDFNADVRAELTRDQRSELKSVRRVLPSSLASRSLGLF